MEKYPWYEKVDRNETLLQGDLVNFCPIIIPPTSTIIGENIKLEVKEYNVIVMSQSCDLILKKIELVLICPYYSLDEFETMSLFFKNKEGKETLRKGNIPGYHLLNKIEIPGFETEFLVVDFRSVFSIPLNFINDLVKTKGERIRLLSPYREHLSQAFARFFMRVGLPVDIPPFR